MLQKHTRQSYKENLVLQKNLVLNYLIVCYFICIFLQVYINLN